MNLNVERFEKGISQEVNSPFFGKSAGTEDVQRVVFKGFEDKKYAVACSTEKPNFLARFFFYTELKVKDSEGKESSIWVNTRSFNKRMTQDAAVIDSLFSKVFPESDVVKSKNLLSQMEKINQHTKDPLTLNEMVKLEEACKKAPQGESKLSKKEHGLARTVVTDSSGQGLILLSCEKSKKDKPYGKGSFGKVVRAIHPTDPTQDKAVKVVRKEKADRVNPTTWRKLEEEVRLMETLKGESRVVQIDKAFQVNDPKRGPKYYIVMKPCDPNDLFARLYEKRDIESFAERERLAGECLEGLAQVHGKNILHRDIKPENIFLKDGHVQIGDFGFAVEKDKVENEFCGTPGFIAPEIFWNKLASEKSDVWSMGCVLYEVLAGRPLSFQVIKDEKNRPNLMKSLKQNSLDWEIEENVLEEYQSLLKQMLQVDPAKRPSAQEALNQFREIFQN